MNTPGNSLAALMILSYCGVMLLIAVRAIDHITFLRRGTVTRTLLIVTGWVLFATGFLTACFLLFLFGVIGFVIFMVILAMALVRLIMYRRNVLLWSLSEAAKQELPVAVVARSVANEQGRFGRRTREVASLMEAGYPVGEALSQCRQITRSRGEAAVRVGEQCGAVAPALSLVVSDDQTDQSFWQVAASRMFYLTMVFVVATSVGTFMLREIVPSFVEIFSEFEIELPLPTRILITASDTLANLGVLFSPVYLLLLLALLYVTLRYIGMRPLRLPIVDRLSSRRHRATVFRCLALAAEHGQPLDQTLETIADWHVAGSIRDRLRIAVAAVQRGANWKVTLQQSGICQKSDLALIDSAQRAGNLAWVLNELADQVERRAAFRTSTALQILSPIALLVMAMFLAFFYIGMFMPLVYLIMSIG